MNDPKDKGYPDLEALRKLLPQSGNGNIIVNCSPHHNRLAGIRIRGGDQHILINNSPHNNGEDGIVIEPMPDETKK